MRAFVFGDVLLIAFPFTDAAGSKRRPALVVHDSGDDDVLVARVTGQAVGGVFDVPIQEWRDAGLVMPSVARVDKLATLEKRLVERRLGHLADIDAQTVKFALKSLLPS
ncbi:MAG: type II toxin-antitoxin system PemK/MazF family toxin [Deltaproteobacteria bacterium]|nr:type II toxin-antitoxin system PemK/MazF family toxin [Deltaproteobacteria bacterium]